MSKTSLYLERLLSCCLLVPIGEFTSILLTTLYEARKASSFFLSCKVLSTVTIYYELKRLSRLGGWDHTDGHWWNFNTEMEVCKTCSNLAVSKNVEATTLYGYLLLNVLEHPSRYDSLLVNIKNIPQKRKSHYICLNYEMCLFLILMVNYGADIFIIPV